MITYFKKITSFIIIFALIVPCLCIGSVEVNAATKKDQPMTLGVSKKTFKESDLKKNSKSFSIGVKNNQGSVSYKSDSSQITVDKKGNVTVKKGIKAGSYKITVTANGNSKYKSGTKTVKVTINSSECEKAINAYKKFLAQDEIDWGDGELASIDETSRFALIYLDNDDVPELVVNCLTNSHLIGSVALYVYRNGKVDMCYNLCDELIGYYEKKGVIVYQYSAQGDYYETYSCLSKNVMTDYLAYHTSELLNTENYNKYVDWSTVVISEKEFNSLLKKKVGDKKMITDCLKTNTKSNRDKYLK